MTFEDVMFEKSDNACRVKSHANGTGRVSGILYRNVTMTDVLWPILVDGFYGSGSQGVSAVLLENITLHSPNGSNQWIRAQCLDFKQPSLWCRGC